MKTYLEILSALCSNSALSDLTAKALVRRANEIFDAVPDYMKDPDIVKVMSGEDWTVFWLNDDGTTFSESPTFVTIDADGNIEWWGLDGTASVRISGDSNFLAAFKDPINGSTKDYIKELAAKRHESRKLKQKVAS